MEMSIPIYKKNGIWYRSVTEIPRDENEKGLFPTYDERIYVEIPGYVVPLDLTLDQLVEMHTNYKWGKTGSLGLRGPHYKFDEHIACTGHEYEVQERAKVEGFVVI